MQLLYRTVVQLEEAKRFILDGDVARLRLALILLDNAVEVIMSRVIDIDVSHIEDRFEPLEAMIDAMVSEIDARIQDKIDWMRGK